MASIKLCTIAVVFASIAFLSCALAAKSGRSEKLIVVPELENNTEEQEPLVIEMAEFAGKHYRPGQLAQILSGGKSERPMASGAGNLQFLVDGPMRMEKKWSRFEPSIRFY